MYIFLIKIFAIETITAIRCEPTELLSCDCTLIYKDAWHMSQTQYIPIRSVIFFSIKSVIFLGMNKIYTIDTENVYAWYLSNTQLIYL